jgi:putative ABC transport system permease protein
MGYPIIRFAWRELLAHPVRSLSAGVGIVVAVAALLAATSLRRSVEKRIVDRAAQGAGLMVLTTGVERQGPSRAALLPGSFDDADLAALRREVPGIDQLAPATSRLALVATASKSHRALVLGTTPDFFALTGRSLALGRWMSNDELSAGAPVCVMGQALRARLFEAADPVGSTVRTGTLLCQVIGVLGTTPGGPASDTDDVLVTPLATLQRETLGAQTVSAIYMVNRADHSPIVVAHQVEMLMRERRRLPEGAPADFTLRAGRDLMAETEVAAPLLAALGGVAAASLLLGGICLMTAMFASIRERRRQLGACLAIGAARRDVAAYFWFEAVLLAAGAALAGVPLGLLLTTALVHRFGLDFGVSGPGVALALLGAVSIGVLFGAPPALLAAQLEPSDPLRQA